MPLTYSTFGLSQAARQARFALQRQRTVRHEVDVLLRRLRRDQARIRLLLGRELRDLDVLEVGPGQHCARARAFGLNNRVTAVDLDEVILGLDPRTLVRAARANGPARVVKTLARKALGVDRALERAWADALGASSLPDPRLVRADVCAALPFAPASFDLVVSWSVFEHLPDPARALENVVMALRPGGVLCVAVHLFTSNSGHHDIRAFTGSQRALPPWAHLRPATKDLVRPSSVLNGWRLRQWRDTFARLTPGFVELQDRYDEKGLRATLTPALRDELREYDDEELLTVDAFFLWRKPSASDVARPPVDAVSAVHAASAPATDPVSAPVTAPVSAPVSEPTNTPPPATGPVTAPPATGPVVADAQAPRSAPTSIP